MMWVCNGCGAEFRESDIGHEHDNRQDFDPMVDDWVCPECGDSQVDGDDDSGDE